MPAVSFTAVTNDSDDRGRDLVGDFTGFIGKVLIVVGLLLLSFVAYQLWGTSFEESRAQSQLAASFSSQVQGPTDTTPDSVTPGTTTPGSPTTSTAPMKYTKLKKGSAIGRIKIPKIGVDKWIVAGIDFSSLKKGPGLYLDRPQPGQRGNAVIAGHRTTFGAPFERIDELKVGDVITVETRQGTFGYVVASTTVVRPTDLSALDPDPSIKSSITLVSCTPKYSASKRIIVRANIAPDNPTPIKPATPLIDSIGSVSGDANPLVAGWFHDTGGVLPASILAVALLLISRIPRLLRKRWNTFPARVGAYALTVVVFSPTLFFFFQNISRLVPTNL